MDRGHVLFELVFILAVIAIVAIVILPSYRGFAFYNDLAVTKNSIVHALNQAQSLARAGEEDSAWSVRVVVGRVTIFKGNDFATRDASYDRIFVIPRSISVSGWTNPITFNKFTGLPSHTQQLTLSNTINQSVTITPTSQGALNVVD